MSIMSTNQEFDPSPHQIYQLSIHSTRISTLPIQNHVHFLNNKVNQLSIVKFS